MADNTDSKVAVAKATNLGDILIDIVKSIAPQAFTRMTEPGKNTAKDMTDTIFSRYESALAAKIEANENGQDGEQVFKDKLGIKSTPKQLGAKK